MKRLSVFVAALALSTLAMSAPSQAVVVVVDALANASSGLSGATALNLTAGQQFSVEVKESDLWSAGALPRWSNANGLTGPNLLATGSDESGELAGTVIGTNFGTYSQSGFTAAYGSLVGEIGAGPFFLIGTSYTGIATSTGTLRLFYWDSISSDNVGSVTATVSAVPEPATWVMLILGFATVGFASYRTRMKPRMRLV